MKYIFILVSENRNYCKCNDQQFESNRPDKSHEASDRKRQTAKSMEFEHFDTSVV